MKCRMELEVLMEKMILPEGIAFYDFGGGNCIMPVPVPGMIKGVDAGRHGVERLDWSRVVIRLQKGSRYSDIELTGLPKDIRNPFHIAISAFAAEVDRGIEFLNQETEHGG